MRAALHLVWCDDKGDAVYYKRYDPNTGSWSKDLQLAKTAGIACPAIALDSDGTTIHVVWRMWKHVGTTNFHIYYQKCVPTGPGTGGWVGSPLDLCENVSGHGHDYPAIACGPHGQVVVTWMESWGSGVNLQRTYGFREYASGTWQPQILIQDSVPSYRWNPSISTDRSGNVFVAYYGSQSLQNRDSFHVYVKSRLGGVWHSWENVTSSMGYPDSFIAPDIDVNLTTGRPHIVCHSYSISVSGTDTTRYYHIYHSYSPSTGVWTVPEMISDPAVPHDGSPSMFFAGDGSAHVVWSGSDADGMHGGIKYAFCPGDGGTWTTPYWLTSNASGISDFSANITVAADNTLHVVWTRYDSTARYPYQIWGSSYSGSYGGPMAGTTVTPRGFTLGITPNPVSRRMVVSYSLPAAGNVSLKLYNVSGVLAKTVASGYVLPGSHAVSLDRQGLVRGAYIMKLESGSGSLTRKFVIE